ncbi:MAG: glycosyltransferase family 4 protein [Chitinophagales bacterium]|nr:glycosyltransferase family 4 protein [Chitinophagales bacterium]
MKIIHLVLGKANPNRMNGVNKVANQLASIQYKQGHDVHLWGIARDIEHNYPARPYATALFLQYPNPFKVDPALKDAIKQLKTDAIVHIHGAFIPVFYYISQLLKKRNIAYVFTPHGSLTEGAMQRNSTIKKIYLHLFERHLILNAKAVQALGIMEKKYIQKVLPKAKMALIPNGQTVSEIPEFPAPSNTHIKFGFCGRLDANHKGLDLLLKGFKLFLEAGNKGHLFLIGGGKDANALKALTQQLKISKHVQFYGVKYGFEKFQLLSECDVFAHTSRMEGFPMAVLEAAAMKKPCLLSEATSVIPFIKAYNAGLALEENNPEAIFRNMRKAAHLHSTGMTTLLGENAQKMVREVFNWDKISHQISKVYAKPQLH